jgi:hypothetical protein
MKTRIPLIFHTRQSLEALNSVLTPHSISLGSFVILTVHLLLGLPSSLFSWDFRSNFWLHFSFHTRTHVVQPCHLFWLNRPNYGRLVKIMTLLIMYLSTFSSCFHILLSTLFSDILNLYYSSFTARDQFLHSYKTMCIIIDFYILISMALVRRARIF